MAFGAMDGGSNPPGTTKLSYIVRGPVESPDVGDCYSGLYDEESLNSQFLNQFEDSHRRMREKARIDFCQTHLTARDARTWGGASA